MKNNIFSVFTALLLAGCASQPKINRASVGVVSAQPTPDTSWMWPQDLAYTKRMKSLEREYGIAITQRVGRVLGGLNFPKGSECEFAIILLPGGDVIKVDLASCHFQPDLDERVRAALVGQTMPYSGFESVYQRTYRLKMCAPRYLCAH